MSTTSKRIQFQKTFSVEHQSEFRRRSIIDDAKFDAALNSEYAKIKKLSEEEESLTQKSLYNIKILFDQDFEFLGKIFFLLKSYDIELRHIESREIEAVDFQYRTNGLTLRHHEILLIISCNKPMYQNFIAALINEDDKHKITPLDLEEKIIDDIWIPMHISDLDKCNHLVVKFQPEMSTDHPGFHDSIYQARRMEVSELAFKYKHGEKIKNVKYNDLEINTWKEVYVTLTALYKDHASKEQIIGIKRLEDECGYGPNAIPQLEDVSNYLKRKSGFKLRPVAGLLSARDFLASLAFRVFQCTQYTRHHSKPLHTPEPDCIHELIGHVPMLSDPEFAEFSEEIGLCSLGASDADIEKLATLYWFTIEFGLCYENGKIKAFGAGLLSSYGELLHAISEKPEHRPFEPFAASITPYRDEDYQPIYYVIDSIRDMKEKVRQFAKSIKKDKHLRYDPYTESIEVLDNKASVCHLGRVIKHELENMENSLAALMVL